VDWGSSGHIAHLIATYVFDFVLARIAELRGSCWRRRSNSARPDTASAQVLEAVNAHTAASRAA
jgi:hypothetical protein